ncbi:transglycosylase domain-containing protein [Limibacter armeniacum]|uniref:transglycosylase domain-containing protein n=1 Tax=Limibacter armeniacum TaxID=466084 RepID=UPI002FE6BC96
MSARLFFKKTARLILRFHLLFILLAGIGALYLKYFNPPLTMLMLYRGQMGHRGMERPSFVPLHDLPEDLRISLINLEDPNFYSHYGFDVKRIQTAYEKNEEKGYFAYGGSTITQQLARTMLLTPHKNYFRKYLELIAALELELILDKDRILELYVNYMEWGNRVYGISDAADYYYKKDVERLSRRQKIKLAAILASPLNFGPSNYKENKLLEARYQLLDKFLID